MDRTRYAQTAGKLLCEAGITSDTVEVFLAAMDEDSVNALADLLQRDGWSYESRPLALAECQS